MRKPSKYQLEVMARLARNLRKQAADPTHGEATRRDFIRRAEVQEAALRLYKFDASQVTD